MSNSGFIKPVNSEIGIYLHWNGGRDSVEAFLKYCELKGYIGFGHMSDYGLARLTQVITNFFGGVSSIGICMDNTTTDNGTYVIDGWEIVERKNKPYYEQNEYDLLELMVEIDKRQPLNEQIGDFLISVEIKTSDLKINDIVFMQELDGTYKTYKVMGFGKIGAIANGTKLYGVPYVNKYKNTTKNYMENSLYGTIEYTENINNFITSDTVRIKK